jgi:hypothetical protein
VGASSSAKRIAFQQAKSRIATPKPPPIAFQVVVLPPGITIVKRRLDEELGQLRTFHVCMEAEDSKKDGYNLYQAVLQQGETMVSALKHGFTFVQLIGTSIQAGPSLEFGAPYIIDACTLKKSAGRRHKMIAVQLVKENDADVEFL